MDWHARKLSDGCEVSDSELNAPVQDRKVILPCCAKKIVTFLAN